MEVKRRMFLKKKSKNTKQYPVTANQVACIVENPLLIEAFEKVYEYVRGSRRTGVDFMRILRQEWARLAEPMKVHPGLLYQLRKKFPPGKNVITCMDWTGIACIFIDGSPKLFVPGVFGKNEFHVGIGEDRFAINNKMMRRIEKDLIVHVKGRNTLCLQGSLYSREMSQPFTTVCS